MTTKRSTDLDMIGCQRLAQAVIVAACDYYREAMSLQAKRPESVRAAGQMSDIERFFRGRLFSAMTGLDPEALIERLRKEA